MSPGTLKSVLITKVLLEESGDTTVCPDTPIDPALIVLNHHAKGLTRLLAVGLRINEALETLLLTTNRAEGLGATLGELRGELGVIERGGTKVVVLHLGYAFLLPDE